MIQYCLSCACQLPSSRTHELWHVAKDRPCASMQAREFMHQAEKEKKSRAEVATRRHASELEASVARSNAEAAAGAYDQAKANVNRVLQELRYFHTCVSTGL